MDPQHFLLSDVATFLSTNGTPPALYLWVRKLEAGLHLRVGWLGVIRSLPSLWRTAPPHRRSETRHDGSSEKT